jgi:hypothetical protein
MGQSATPPNNLFNQSANSAVFIDNLILLTLNARPVNSGVGRLRHRDFVDNH